MAEPTMDEILGLVRELCETNGIDRWHEHPALVVGLLANRYLLLQQKVDQQVSLIAHLVECEAGLARQLEARRGEPAEIERLRTALAHYATDEEPWGWVAIEALRGPPAPEEEAP